VMLRVVTVYSLFSGLVISGPVVMAKPGKRRTTEGEVFDADWQRQL